MLSSRDAVLQVLQTAELLQEILLHLDMRSLLTAAQRVSRQWRELITTSPPLQRALYFKPVVRAASRPTTLNPLLVKIFRLWFKPSRRHLRYAICHLHRDHFKRLPIAQASRRQAFMHPTATWRQMLVQQPPVLRLGYWGISDRSQIPKNYIVTMQFEDGLRMDTFYDVAQQWLCLEGSSFNVVWDPRVLPTEEKIRRSFSAHLEETDMQSFADDLQSLKSEAEIVLLCSVKERPPGERGEGSDYERDESFSGTFAYAPSGQGNHSNMIAEVDRSISILGLM
ncbi:hypothetical protein F5Y10DRAFT_254641 [Nemania abortiva]|nr:hypothetical protein F5Y10DRAFT_254641 [Nemania abortiva]